MSNRLSLTAAMAEPHVEWASFDLGRVHWYAIQSKRNDEARAEDNVRSRGIETFLPRALVVGRGRGGASRTIVEPLFTGYFFVRCNIAAAFNAVRYAPGVANVVCTAHVPSIVDDEIIASIRSRLDSDGLVHLVSDLAAGDRVRVADGPLRDFMGTFRGTLKGSERAVLLLGALERFRVVVDHTALRKVS
jgi:transcription antitermination factor NusG